MLKAYEIIGKIFKVSESTEFKGNNEQEYTKGTMTVLSGVKHEVDGKAEYDNEFIELEFIEKKKEKDSYVKDQLNKFKKDDIITFSGELKIEAFVKKDGRAGYSLKSVNPNISIFENTKNNQDIKKEELVEEESTKQNKKERSK